MNTHESFPSEYRGWWRIIETSQWSSKFLDSLGPTVLSLTGYADRLRMHCLLAYVNCKPTKSGVSFTWEGAWEFLLFGHPIMALQGSGTVVAGAERLRLDPTHAVVLAPNVSHAVEPDAETDLLLLVHHLGRGEEHHR